MKPFALVALAALAVACCKPVSSEAGARPTATSATPIKMKQHDATPDDRLGTLAAGLGIAAGQPAPSATLSDSAGKSIELAGLWKEGPILLVFYRGGWCPYCNFQIHELTAAYPEYQRRGVTPVAVSVDKPDESARTQPTYAIPFPVLSDPDLAAHDAFHVVHEADAAEVARLKGFGIDVERSSGRNHHRFAVPSMFLIDDKGVVRWAHADPDYKVRPTTAQILAAVDKAGFAPR